jgi:surface antigen
MIVRSALLASCFVAITATMTLAAAYHDFFGRERRLNAKDLQLLHMSLRQALEAGVPGASASWQDDQTKEAGRASVVRIYQHNGMPCAEVEHVFATGNRYRYVLLFCRKDGEWKMAF